MSRLINDELLKESIREKTLFVKWQKVLIEMVIDDQPTVDAVPVVHGRWIYNDYGNGCGNWHCSVCRNIFIGYGTEDYCPNCGADMRGEQDG